MTDTAKQPYHLVDPSPWPALGAVAALFLTAGTVLFIKRSMGSGYAGIQNELFFRDNTMMLLSDAKKMVEDIVKAL